MAYDRDVRKKVNGKFKPLGAYYYESYRDEKGITRTKYLQKKSCVVTKKSFLKTYLLILLVVFALGFNFSKSLAFFVTGLITQNNSNNLENNLSENANEEINNSFGEFWENKTQKNKSIENFTESLEFVEEESVKKLEKQVEGDFKEILFNSKIVIGRPVKWIKKITLEGDPDVVEIELPKEAIDIVLKTGEEVEESLSSLKKYEEIVETSNRKEIVGGKITGLVSLDIKEGEGVLINFFNWIRKITITGKIVSQEEIEKKIIEKNNKKIVVLDKEIIGENEISLEYYTEAPKVSEEIIWNGKRIIISTLGELDYQNILTYIKLEDEFEEGSIKLFHLENGGKKIVEFDTYDLNENGLVDYIEWIVPHLSEQVYEVVIEISQAEHLDENKYFISNIYEEVFQKDNIWSELINDGEYVKVLFEKQLNSENDITIYPRVISGDPKIEIYDGEKIVAEFELLESNKYNKVFLTNLEGIQDVFYLKIVGGAIEIDHIIDPSTNLIVTSCKVDGVVSSTCYNAISVDGGTSYSLAQSSYIYAPFQNLSGVESVISASLNFDVTADLNGIGSYWEIDIKSSEGGTIICGYPAAAEPTSETRITLTCNDINSTQLSNGIWLYIYNGDTKGQEFVVLDYVFFVVNYTSSDLNSPEVNIISPLNETVNTTSHMIDFKYNVTDTSVISSCDLILNGSVNKTILSPAKNETNNISVELPNEVYLWNINCTDEASNVGKSELRVLTVNVSNAISVYLSPALSQKINWTINTLPLYNSSAEDNNEEGVTDYYINISSEGQNVDVYLKADDDLKTISLDVLGLGNETYSFNLTNSTVPSDNKYSLTTTFTDNKIGNNLLDGSVIYLKFFLNAPSHQPAGIYNNSFIFSVVPYGENP